MRALGIQVGSKSLSHITSFTSLFSIRILLTQVKYGFAPSPWTAMILTVIRIQYVLRNKYSSAYSTVLTTIALLSCMPVASGIHVWRPISASSRGRDDMLLIRFEQKNSNAIVSTLYGTIGWKSFKSSDPPILESRREKEDNKCCLRALRQILYRWAYGQ